MSARGKRTILVSLLAALVLILVILASRSEPSANGEAIVIGLLGYTNSSNRRFALFSVSNQSSFTIRWRGDRVELEDSPRKLAKIINPNLPGFRYDPVLKSGQSLLLAIGDPKDSGETSRWRFTMSYSRYTPRERWLDYSLRYKLPVIVDASATLDVTNRTTSSSSWLSN